MKLGHFFCKQVQMIFNLGWFRTCKLILGKGHFGSVFQFWFNSFFLFCFRFIVIFYFEFCSMLSPLIKPYPVKKSQIFAIFSQIENVSYLKKWYLPYKKNIIYSHWWLIRIIFEHQWLPKSTFNNMTYHKCHPQWHTFRYRATGQFGVFSLPFPTV